MEKGNVKLKDLVSLISPAGRVRIYKGAGDNPEEVFNGYRANLTRNELIEQGHEVQHFALVPEFYKKDQSNTKGHSAIGNPAEITPENAEEYAYSDLCMKLFTDIYLF